ncbi:NRT1/ PTR family 1.1-like protein [Tanacetum coccineum]
MEMSYVESERAGVSKQGLTKTGGLRTMPFIIANESFERVASVGLKANMILYLKTEYHLSSATGANILFLWGAISGFMPTLGAFLSDSYFGRFHVIGVGSIFSLIGMTSLWLTAVFPSARPLSCDLKVGGCTKPTHAQIALLFTSFAIMSIGAGGIRPCSLAFGADQFDRSQNPKNAKILQRYFNWYYASVGISVMISVTVIVYIQTVKGWIVGFGIPAGLMLLSAVMFFLGSSLYVKVRANKSMFSGFFQVISASFKNKHLDFPPKNSNRWYHHKKGSKILVPTNKIRFLNKACIVSNPEKDVTPTGEAINPWRLCTVKQVEEFKALIKVLPIWSSGIMIAVTVNQHSFPVLQALSMDRQVIGNFKIPPGSFDVFSLLTLTIWVALYDQLLVRQFSKFTKLPQGLSLKQRMGIGLFLSCTGMAVSAMVERKRRDTAISQGLYGIPYGVVNMSAFWLVPQYSLLGLAEAFNAIGQIEFYYSQFPKSMASIGVALFALGLAVGNLVGSLIVIVVNGLTKQGGRISWVANNLNQGRLDYYYWILAILSLVNFFYFLWCSWAYGPCDQPTHWDDEIDQEEVHEEQSVKGSTSPVIISSSYYPTNSSLKLTSLASFTHKISSNISRFQRRGHGGVQRYHNNNAQPQPPPPAKRIRVTGFDNFSIQYLGGLYLLIQLPHHNLASKILSNPTISSHLSSFKPWNNQFLIKERLTWITISGLPLQLWLSKSFTDIAKHWGKVIIQEDRNTLQFNRTTGKVCILTNHLDFIRETVTIPVNKEVISVHVHETEGDIDLLFNGYLFDSSSDEEDNTVIGDNNNEENLANEDNDERDANNDEDNEEDKPHDENDVTTSSGDEHGGVSPLEDLSC